MIQAFVPAAVARAASRAWVLAAAWTIAIAALAGWLIGAPEGILRNELRQWQFWSLEILFLLLAALWWINLPALWRSLRLERRDLGAPLAAAALACLLAGFVAPKTNRIYYDEQIYQGIGQNLADLKLAQMCNDGNVEYGTLQCWRGEYNKEPYAYPYLLSLVYRVAGVHDGLAQMLNAGLAALLVLVVFLLTVALTDRVDAASFASLVAALIPEQIRWAHTAAAEPSAALACACAVLAAAAFVRSRSHASLLWVVASSAFAVQFRTECVLIVPVVLAVIGACAPEEFRRPRLWWAGLLGLVLLSVHIGHLAAVRNEGWGTTGPRLSPIFFRMNLRANGWFYLGDSRFPVLYTIAALAALGARRHLRAVSLLVVYFVCFWAIFLFFYAGSYNYGADDRFSLMTYPPMAALAGIGLATLAAKLRHWTPAPGRAIAAALCAQFLWYMPLVRSIGEEAWGARADVAFAHGVLADLPPNSIVLTHNPNMFHLWGRSAAQAAIAATEPAYVGTVLAPRYAGGVFFHWNFWCEVADPLQRSFCTGLLDKFPHTLVREYHERDYRYALYRLELEHPPAGTGR